MEEKANMGAIIGSLTASQYSDAVRLADWRVRQRREAQGAREYLDPEDDRRERLRRFTGG